jgi:hypothetical protein
VYRVEIYAGWEAVFAGKPAPTGLKLITKQSFNLDNVRAGKPAPTGFKLITKLDFNLDNVGAGLPAKLFKPQR